MVLSVSVSVSVSISLLVSLIGVATGSVILEYDVTMSEMSWPHFGSTRRQAGSHHFLRGQQKVWIRPRRGANCPRMTIFCSLWLQLVGWIYGCTAIPVF